MSVITSLAFAVGGRHLEGNDPFREKVEKVISLLISSGLVAGDVPRTVETERWFSFQAGEAIRHTWSEVTILHGDGEPIPIPMDMSIHPDDWPTALLLVVLDGYFPPDDVIEEIQAIFGPGTEAYEAWF